MAEVSIDSQSPEDKIAETLRTAKFEADRFLRSLALDTSDERKCYVYLICLPDGTPRYVGKGQGRRIRQHAAAGENHTNFLLAADYKKHGKLPIAKLVEHLTHHEAYALEECLIEFYGVEGDGGPLANLNLGGDCVAPLVGVARERHKAALREYLSQPDVREKRLQQLKNIRSDEEIQARRAENIRKGMADPEFRARRSTTGREVSARPDVIAKRSAGISKGQTASWNRRAERFEIRGELLTRKQISTRYGLSYGLVKNRVRAGLRGEELIAPVDERFSRHRI